ncbi:MAG TPA: IPT/TIG domain-containing protein [Candidatus Polarisedimenticolaceae bacterium]|nr:IPT/TIG domain-containing protein [Candidatus Polarisedimenticolaceae bacterium]
MVYIYDENGRLVAVIDQSAPASSNVAVYNYDAVGNLVSIERRASSVVSVLRFSPTCAPAGASLTISGTGFSNTAGQNRVTFGSGATAYASAANAFELTVAVPSNASGAVTVTNTATGLSGSSAPRTFAVGCSGPHLASVSPTTGPAGTAVVLMGTGFDALPTNDVVTFNGTPAPITAVTATRIDAVVPAAAASGRVHVTTPFGTTPELVDLTVPPGNLGTADLAPTVWIPFPPPGVVSVSIVAGKTSLVLFDAPQGHRFGANLAPQSGDLPGATLALYGRDGSALDLPFAWAFWGPTVLPGSGTYTLAVASGNGTGSVHLRVWDVPADSIYRVAALDSTVNVAAGPGQRVTVLLAYDGPGEQVNVCRSPGDFQTYTEGTVTDPEDRTIGGGALGHVADTGFDHLPFSAPGTYRVLSDPIGADQGKQTVGFFRTPPDIVGSLTSDVTFTMTTQVARLSFSRGANDCILLAVSNPFTSSLGCLSVTMLDPNGSPIAGWTNQCSSTFAVARAHLNAGTYTLVVDPGGCVAGGTVGFEEQQWSPDGCPQ